MLVTKRRFVGILLLVVLLLAAFFRFWHLDELPPGLYHDEAYNGLDALSLLQGKTFPQFYEGWELYAADAHAGQPARETRFPLFFEGNYGREPLHVYFIALSVFLFGATPFAVRAVPAAAGVLAVLTTFLAAAMLLNNRKQSNTGCLVPLLAALTMAILYPAVHFSRFGIRAMLFVPLETLAVASFWWGVNRVRREPDAARKARSWLPFLLAGFLIGLAIYTFAASRLFPFVWIVFVPIWFIADRQAFGRHWRHILAMAGAALLTALPLLLFFWRYPYYFVFRIAYVANKGKGAVEGKPWMTWLLNVGRVLRGLLWQGETHLRHNLPGRPFLDPVQAVLFLLGLVNSLRQIVQPRVQFLLIWLGVMLLPSILSGDAPHFGRLSGAAAPLAIVVALGADWLYIKMREILSDRVGMNKGSSLAGLFILLLFGVSALWTGVDYFGRYAQHPQLAADFYLADWQMGQYAQENGADGRLYLSPTQEELATILFALEDVDRLRNYNGQDGLIPAGIPGETALYLLRPGDERSFDALRSYFPNGVEGAAGEGYVPFRVNAGDPRIRMEQEAEYPFADKIALVGWTAVHEGDQLRVSLAWQAQKPMVDDYTAYIHLTDADGTLIGQLDRPPAGYPTSDWQSKEIVVDSFVVPLPSDLSAGAEFGISTGFYYLPTLESLGEPVQLSQINLEIQD